MAPKNALQGRVVAGFTQIPNFLLKSDGVRRMCAGERLTLMVLMAYWPKEDIHIETLSKDTEMSRVTIYKHLKSLESRGYIVMTRGPGITIFNYTPFLDSIAVKAVPTVSTMAPGIQMPDIPVVERDPDALTPEQEKIQKEFEEGLAAKAWTVAGVPPPPSGGPPRWQDLGANELRKKLIDVKQSAAGQYYPSLGDSGCEEQLNVIMKATYDLKPPSHNEAWYIIGKQYSEFIKALGVSRGYDSAVEYQKVNDAYARFSETSDVAVEFIEFIRRYYQGEFREFDKES